VFSARHPDTNAATSPSVDKSASRCRWSSLFGVVKGRL
jgi:hypothetical protein